MKFFEAVTLSIRDLCSSYSYQKDRLAKALEIYDDKLSFLRYKTTKDLKVNRTYGEVHREFSIY